MRFFGEKSHPGSAPAARGQGELRFFVEDARGGGPRAAPGGAMRFLAERSAAPERQAARQAARQAEGGGMC